MLAYLPGHTLVLDIVHAAEHLWQAANALLGERHPERAAWVRAHLGRLLAVQAAVVAADLEEAAPAPALSKARRPVAQQIAANYRRNLPYMLRRLPGGHLIRDRMEQAGMCWTLAGAQAVLDLRAVRLNDHWDDYWAFHRQQQQQRLYGATAPPARAPETRALEVAA